MTHYTELIRLADDLHELNARVEASCIDAAPIAVELDALAINLWDLAQRHPDNPAGTPCGLEHA